MVNFCFIKMKNVQKKKGGEIEGMGKGEEKVCNNITKKY